MKIGFGILLLTLVASAPQAPQTFTGAISDDMCARADHSRMRMGPTDAECTVACVDAHGAEYVLYDGKTAYPLKASQPLAKFAGQKVRVTGTLDAKTGTIHVESIALAADAAGR
jgi:hypothetical protein